ncbi:MAG: hypothetical protein PVH61_01435 [Candidatus Aminicenantes bacterium]|jgi:hypothetical protein
MRKNSRKLLILTICWLVGQMGPHPGDLIARELNFAVSYYGSYSDNIFMNASKVKDYLSQLQADLFVSSKRFNFYLDTSVDIFVDNPEFNSFNIEPGIEYLHPLKGRNALYLDLSYTILNYKDLYTDFNTSGPLIQSGIKLYISPQTLLKAGARFQSRNYANFESFDFSNYNAFIEFNHFFKSQTNLRLQTGFNYRYYPHILASYDFGDNYNYYNNRGSNGKGKGPGQHQPPGQNPQYNTMSVPNFYGLLGINQGIGTRLGINGELELRKNLREFDHANAETLIKNAYILYPLNDDYLWDGVRLTLQLKMVLFNRLAVSVEGRVSYSNKNYPGIFIMDEEGNPIEPTVERKDSLLLYMLKISKKIGKLELFTDLFYRYNDSNDDYFFYKMLTISAGMGYYF